MSGPRTRWIHFAFGALVLVLLFALGCSDDPVKPDPEPEPGPEEIRVDSGDIGVVVDTREIFRKGHVPDVVIISFPDHPMRSATLEVDPLTNLGILNLDVDDLTESEIQAFGSGVRADMEIRDDGGTVLADVQIESLVLDSRNIPLMIGTDLESTSQPVALREGMPYLIQYEYGDGVMSQSDHNNTNFHTDYVPDLHSMQYYFTEVEGEPYVYTVQVQPATMFELLNWARYEIYVIADTDHYYPPLKVRMLQDEKGWVTMSIVGTDEYICNSDDQLVCLGDRPTLFRIISDHIDWEIIDRGTRFNQPIMPPATLEFAYEATLRNCTPGELTEEVGQTQIRKRKTSFQTMESFQLFQSSTEEMNLTIGLSVTAKVGIDIEGIGEAGEEVTVSEQIEMKESFTTAQTSVTERTWGGEAEEEKQVSRQRTTTVPPQTAVYVYDAVKSIKGARVPFTQTLRVSGVDKETREPLTGEEVRAQMLFNMVGGVITAVGVDYVEMTLRGVATIDDLFEATTNQEEIIGACD